MKHAMRMLAGFLVVSLYVASGTAQASLLVNPSFENPALSSGTFTDFTTGQTIGSGWVVQQGPVALIEDTYASGGTLWPNPTDGAQFLYVGDALLQASIYQDVILSATTSYRLSFDLANFLDNVNPAGALLYVDIQYGGSSILGSPAQFTRPAMSDFAGQSFDFSTVAAGSYRFVLSQPGGYGTNIDNFALTTAVPEPSTYFMLCLSLGVVGYTRRFISRKVQ